jgi:predicted nucleic acid-binding protein
VIKELCLDANVVIRALIDEADDGLSVQLMRRVDELRISMREPALLVFEVNSVLHRKNMQGDISEELYDEVFDAFFNLPISMMWQDEVMKDSTAVARAIGQTKLYDSTYIAVARTWKIPLVTEDQVLWQKGRQIYPQILTVQECLRRLN